MPINPSDWNVVVVGKWNRAILTPAGIARRLFQLPSGTPVQVAVPLDVLAPFAVTHGGIMVTASNERLVLTATEPEYEVLDRARIAAVNAIRSLPETPLIAAGVNIRHTATDETGLSAILQHPSDDRLSDDGLVIVERSHKRTIAWNEGVVNISLQTQAETPTRIEFNFSLSSTIADELVAWLDRPIAEITQTSNNLIEHYLQIDREAALV